MNKNRILAAALASLMLCSLAGCDAGFEGKLIRNHESEKEDPEITDEITEDPFELSEFEYDGTTITRYIENSEEEIVISNNFIAIGELAFSNCLSLTSVTIPDSVTNFGDKNIFSVCDMLTIKCKADSDAENYAIKNNIPYENY